MRKLSLRSLMVLFWIGLIALVLYFPKWNFASYHDNTINVFAWGDILDPTIIADFEKETGIRVNLSYYATNEEMITKLKATKGEGYDLILPSDYAVPILVEEGLLKEINKERLSFWNQINPNLLGHFFDPDNRHSIPFEWEIFGFGIDKEFFEKHPTTPSWKMIFDPKTINYKISMVNDPIEGVEFAAFYLYGPSKDLTPEQSIEVRNLLIQQRKWVEAYAEFRGDYFLATKNCAVIIASSSYIWRSMRLFDFIGFVIPEEGSFISIENLSIPKASNRDKLVYRFINYLYQPRSVAAHYETYGYFPASLHPSDMDGSDQQAKEILEESYRDFSHYHFFQNILPQDETRDIWVEVKVPEL